MSSSLLPDASNRPSGGPASHLAGPQAEEALRDSEERFKEMLENAPIGIFRSKLEGRYLAANPAMYRLFGYDSEGAFVSEITDIDHQIYVHPEQRRAILRQALATDQHVHAEVEVYRKDGAILTINLYLRLVRGSAGEGKWLEGYVEDITERKRAERALKESERNYREIFNATNDAIFIHDAETGGVLDVNEPMLRLFGLSREEALKLEPNETSLGVSPYSAEEAREWMRKAITEGPQVFEWRARKKDGLVFWVEVGLRRANIGGKDRILAVVRDVTERVEAAEALRSAHQRLMDTIQSLPDATFIIDQQRRIIAWNRACEELTGFREEAMLGQTDYAYAIPFYGDRRPLLIDLLDLPSAEVEATYKYVRRFGNQIYAEAFAPRLHQGKGAHLWGVATPLFDRAGQRFGSIEVIRDITDLKRAEQALQNSEERLRSITSAALDAIVMLDQRGRITFWNQAAEAMFGLPREKALGLSLHETFTPEHYRESQQAGFSQFQLTGQSAVLGRIIQLTARHHDGHEFPVELSVAPVQIEGKLQLVGIIRNISERKRGEEALAAAQAAQATLVEQLRQTQKLEAIGTLAGGIAHDFNNILGAMISYTELALQAEPGSPQVQEDLAQVLKACERAKDLVRQILTFSSHTRQERKPVSLVPILKEALKLLRSSLPATIEMETQLQPGLLQVMADPTQIHQILMNLCTNAAHAMRGKPGRLRVQLERFEARPDLALLYPELRPGPYLRLTVSDTGHGMNKEIRRRLFEPFFTTKGPGEGTGLGLSVVHGIVRDHDGAIRVESEVGFGTTVHIYLPALEAEAPDAESRFGGLVHGQQERILFVDDEPALGLAVARMLRKLNYQVTVQSDPYLALEWFRNQPDQIDLVITDLTMPGMTGADLAAALRAIRPAVPILLASGFSGTYTPERVRDMGMNGLLQKPISLQDLSRAVQEALHPSHDPT